MIKRTLVIGIAIGLLLGTTISHIAAEEMTILGLPGRVVTARERVPSAARERPRLATSLQPTPTPPRCAEAAKVVHQTSLVSLRGETGGAVTNYVLGTARNTCTVTLEVALEMHGASDEWPDQGVLRPIGRSEKMVLAPGQERAFYHRLDQHPPHELAALIVVPRCRIDTGRASQSAELRRCHELALGTSTRSR
jgi:hypothetical protein